MKPLIYALCEPDSGEVRYVGQTVNLKKRIQKHYYTSELNQKTHKACWLKSLVAKGKKAEVIIVQEANSIDDLDQLEIMWIVNYKSIGCDLVNHSEGGGGRRGWTPSAEMRAEISKRTQGKKNPFYGKKHTEETRKLISLNHSSNSGYQKGHKQTPNKGSFQKGRVPHNKIIQQQ